MDKRKRLIALLVLGTLLIAVPIGLRTWHSAGPAIEPSTAEYFPVQDPDTGKWGFIDNTGKPLTPMVFDWAGDYRQGLGLAQSDGEMGYIDASFEKTGKWAISPRFTVTASVAMPASGFYDGLARARDGSGKWGYIDKTGAWAIEPTYIESDEFTGVPIGEFAGGLAWYQAIDMADRLKLNDKEEIVRDNENKPLREPYRRRLFGFIDRKGKVVIQPRFEMVQDFGEGLAGARFKTNDLWGFIDRTGKRVLSPEYQGVGRFSEGLCAVKFNGLWGYIDKAGQWVIQPRFVEVRQFLEGLAPARESDQWGYINPQGDWVIEPVFDDADESRPSGDARPFENGVAKVTLQRKTIYIDKTGKQVWPKEED